MKKLVTILTLIGVLSIGASKSFAQADTTQAATETPAPEPTVTEVAPDAAVVEEESFHQALKGKFIEGGAPFMWPILIVFIIGLAISIERIITLNLATTNTKKLLASIEDALASCLLYTSPSPRD